MKTELLHSYSSNSLANLSRAYSSTQLNKRATIDGHEKHGEINPSFETGDEDGLRGFGDSTQNVGAKDTRDKLGAASDLCHSIFKKKLLYKRLPVLNWSQEYNTTKLVADIISGVTIGLTILPQGLAYAKIAGLPPQYGLYSGFIGCFVYILFGGSKIVTIGPTAIQAIITLSYTQGKPPEYSVLLCFLTGIVSLCMGIFQMGFIVNFISTPVISGFTSAAALTICSTQIKPLLGLSFKADGFRDIIIRSIEHVGEIRHRDAILSFACIVTLLFMQNLQAICRCFTKNSPKLDRVLWFIATSRSVIVIVVCTIIFSCIDIELFPVKVVGAIVPGLPPVRFPPFSVSQNISGQVEEISFLDLLKNDMSALIVIPLLATMEHFTIAKKYSGTSMLDASQEMLSIGISNIVGCFFSSMPVTGSFSRSVVNAASGAESPMGGLITGTLVILALQFLTPYFYFIPDASLAAVIISAVIFTVDFRIALDMWRSKKMDLIPWGFTFLVSLLVTLEAGILSGIIISVIFTLYYAARPAVQIKRAETTLGNEFVIVGLDRSVQFPSIAYIRYMVSKARKLWAKNFLPVVIDCHHIQYCDFSAAQGICDLFTTFNAESHPLILWKAKPSIIRILQGLMDSCNVPFQYCMSDEDLERTIDGDGDDKPIEFTVSLTPSPTQVEITDVHVHDLKS